ncbi:MAG: hypothetical protein LIQ30_04925 [Planctomycetes bacterium]|nr:hypothetical protein [Planctomycetota bacterium]
MADAGKSGRKAGRKSALRELRNLVDTFYALTAGNTYDVHEILRNYGEMSKVLKNVADRKNVIEIFSAEMAVLTVEKIHLDIVFDRYAREDQPITRELKTDRTSLHNGIEEIKRALSALEIRERDPVLYHEISDASRPLGELDSHGVSKDVVRKCARSQAKRLQDQARGKSKSVLDRKEQSVIATRRDNLEACERLYISEQQEFAHTRARL